MDCVILRSIDNQCRYCSMVTAKKMKQAVYLGRVNAATGELE